MNCLSPHTDVAVGAFLSDSAVVLRYSTLTLKLKNMETLEAYAALITPFCLRVHCRTRPVIQVTASLSLPEQIDQRLALCEEHKTPTVCLNVTVCFSVKSRRYTGAIGA